MTDKQNSPTRARLSISAATTYEASFDEDLVAYADAEVGGIGIWEYKLGKGDDAAIDALAKSSLTATVCVPLVPGLYPDRLFPEPTTPQDRRRAMVEGIKRLAQFEPQACLFLANIHEGVDPREARPVVIDGLKAAAETAGELGISLALEPLRAELGTLAVTPSDGVELIEEADVSNVGLLLDTWHFWDLPNIEEELVRHVSKVLAVQINGRAPNPRSWCDRLLPGEGVIKLAETVALLERIGYDGWYDVEIFSDNGQFGDMWPDSLWALGAGDLAARTAKGFRRAWEVAMESNAN
ncbi:MAG: sugar phosphate isomerase/epimerase family protein [Sciscionella sp.]